MTRIPTCVWVLCCVSCLRAQSPSVSLTALPSPILRGGSSTLSWSATCPTSTCTYSIDQGIGSVSASGTRSVNPASTTTYTLQVNSASVGIFEATATVFVGMGNLSVTQSTAAANGGAGCATVSQYGVCELTFTYPGAGCGAYVPTVKGCTGGTVTNPWENVTIAATFTGQTSGQVYTVGGFYMGGANSGNGNVWAVRFAPQTAEAWNCTATFSSPTDYKIFTSNSLFTSAPNPNAHGFLKLNGGSNPYILQTYDGTPFYPFVVNVPGIGDLGNNSVEVGELFGAIGSGQAPATGYQSSVAGPGDYLGPFLTSGYNMLRNLTASSTPSLVIGSLGVNNNVYLTGNTGGTSSPASMTFDALYRMEASLGFHVWCTPTANPYYWLSGGNVFTNAATTQEYMRYLQYMINRWGAYCDVYELSNEVSPVTSFQATMGSWVKQQDPYGHLTAASYANSSPVAGIDLQSNHLYQVYTVSPTTALANNIATVAAAQHANLPNSPIIYGEAGNSTGASDPPYNEDFRQWMWTSFFNQAFMSLWPQGICNGISTGVGNVECIGTQQLAQMAVFSTFAGSVDPAAVTLPLSGLKAASGQVLRGYALGSATDLAGYIVNASNTSAVNGATVAINIPAAKMAGEWISPSTGAVISTFTTSAAAGTQTFSIPVFSGTKQNRDIAFRIRSAATPVVMTNAAPGCLINTSCTLTLGAAGGTGVFSWTVTGGALPPGLTLNTRSGAIAGTPTQAGNWNFSVTATDSSSAPSKAQNLILVVFPAIAVGNTQLDNYPINASTNGYHLPIVVTGGMPPVSCSVLSGAPPGLTYNGFCGNSGAATTAGNYSLAVQATDGLGNQTVTTINTTVPSSTLGIVAATNPNATVNWPYNFVHILAVGGSGSTTWAVTSGSLPAGTALSVANNYAAISGTPTRTGTSTFALTATNSAGPSAPQYYTIKVNSAPFITISSLPSFSSGSAYYAPIVIAGGTAPFWCSVMGALPAGFVIDAASCEIYGTTAATGSFPITVTAYDSNGANVSSSYTLSSAATINMALPAQTITFGALSDVFSGVGPFPVSATASSGLPVSFASATPDVCAVSETTVTVGGVGICWIVASQPGNESVAAADPVAESFTVQETGGGGPFIMPGGVGPVFSSSTTVTPGSWASVYGSNLAPTAAVWNGDFPTTLGGVTVTIDGQRAYLSYVGPAQINLQVPDDTTTGAVDVTIANDNGSWTSTVTLVQFSPAFSLFDVTHVAGIILRSDGSGAYDAGLFDIIGPTGASFGYPHPAVAAKAGDSVVLFGVGFGPTVPPVPAGQVFAGSALAAYPVGVMIGQVAVPCAAGMGSAGLYQINLTIPAGLGPGDHPLTASVGGVQTQTGILISLQ